MSTLKKEKGFSLVELAIVFVVMGVLLAVGIKMLAPMLGRAKINETDKIVKAAVDSIVGYVAIEHELPDEFKAVVTTSEDIWGNDLIFRAANMNPVDICNESKTDMEVTSCFDQECSPSRSVTIPNIALVVFSKGEDLKKQTDEAGVKVYPKGTVIKDPGGLYNDMVYDDVVKWVSLNELRVKAGCTGAPLKILNNELPTCGKSEDNLSMVYKATIYADGGVGNYQWCRQESSITGLKFKYSDNDSDILAASASCTWDAATSTGTGTWVLANNIKIEADPSVGNDSYNLTFYVHDADGNIASKSLVTTLDPSCIPVELTAEIAEDPEEAAGTPDVYVCHQTCTTSCETVTYTCPSDNSNSNGNGNMNGNSNSWDKDSNGNSNANGNGNENGNSNLNANDNGAYGYDGCVEWSEEVCAAPVCTGSDLQIDVADLAEHTGHGDPLGACDSGIVVIDGDKDNDNYSDKDEYDCSGGSKDGISNSNSTPSDKDGDGWCDGKDAYDNDNSQH
ncbi:MAG: prepilin-type N-terminal cleavage/methylation domain-containing protein [Thermodesulfovibrionia bacterium]|nr:prepilin-type N-terminal cleavage/methylation domain-containing protein [Thermodesulfovibrionia bacterium]